MGVAGEIGGCRDIGLLGRLIVVGGCVRLAPKDLAHFEFLRRKRDPTSPCRAELVPVGLLRFPAFGTIGGRSRYHLGAGWQRGRFTPLARRVDRFRVVPACILFALFVVFDGRRPLRARQKDRMRGHGMEPGMVAAGRRNRRLREPSGPLVPAMAANAATALESDQQHAPHHRATGVSSFPMSHCFPPSTTPACSPPLGIQLAQCDNNEASPTAGGKPPARVESAESDRNIRNNR